MGAFINLLGQRFGRLIVIERAPNNPRHQAMWKCVCDCGKEVVVESGHLRSGHTQSCGCYGHQRASEYHYKHGMKGTRLFSVFNGMKRRCNNPKDAKYPRYGGRGIKVCDEWMNDSKAFYDWALSHGYKEGLSIDRIDNDGDYCPENCRWADAETQANNKSRTCYYTYQGKTLTIGRWAKELGLSYKAVRLRIAAGTFEKHFGKKNAQHTFVTHGGVTQSIADWSRFLELPYSVVRSRVQRGSFDRLFPKEKEEELKNRLTVD